MSKLLIEKLRRAREVTVDADGHKFTVRRPTDADAAVLSTSTRLDMLRQFVVGWDLTELQIVPGGGPDPVPFDAALWAEWIADQPELWEPLGSAIENAYVAHAAKRTAAEKN
jgi:hypothetical protein